MTPAEGSEAGAPALGARDAAIAAALFLAALALYAATRQARIYGHDGAFLASAFALPAVEGTSNSALYAPAAEALRGLCAREGEPLRPLYWLSHAGGALGVCGAFAIARALGAGRRGALLGAGLLACAPAQWFYATTIETHALHVGAVAVAAVSCLLAPWRRPWLARALVAPLFLLLYPTHQSAVLLWPGFLLLARAARARPAGRAQLAWDALCFGAAALASVALANRLLGAGWTLFARETAPTRFLDQFTRRFTLETAWQGFALALFVLPAAGAWALAGGRAPKAARDALCALVLVPVAVVLWLSIPERGAYLLGAAPFLAALCAFAPLPAGARGHALALFLVALQAAAGAGEVTAYGALFPIEERPAAVRAAIGERGVLITLNPNVPRTAVFLPDVVDYDLSAPLAASAARGAPPEELAARIETEVRRALETSPVALDLSYRRLYEPPPSPALVAELEPYVVAIERRLEAAFETHLHPHAWWPLLVIER